MRYTFSHVWRTSPSARMWIPALTLYRPQFAIPMSAVLPKCQRIGSESMSHLKEKPQLPRKILETLPSIRTDPVSRLLGPSTCPRPVNRGTLRRFCAGRPHGCQKRLQLFAIVQIVTSDEEAVTYQSASPNVVLDLDRCARDRRKHQTKKKARRLEVF